MTLITRYPGGSWDSTLPLMPKQPLAVPFHVSHEFNASRIDALPGASVTSWANEKGAPPLTNTVGGVLRSEGRSQYIEFSGVSGSLTALNQFPMGTLRTILVVARPNTGDTLSGVGPVFTWNNDGVVQRDADTASMRSSSGSVTLPAARDKWHVYGVVLPAIGSALFSVDNKSAVFPPMARDIDTVQLGIGLTDRRALRVAHVLASTEALDAGELAEATAVLKRYYADLTW